MDAEALIYLAFLVIWFVSGIVAQIRKMMGNDGARQEAEPPPFDMPPVPQQRPGSQGTGAPSPRPVRRQPPPQRPSSPSQRPAQTSQRPPAPAARPALPPPPLGSGSDVMKEMLRQLGMEVVVQEERPVASEHRRTASEHRRTAMEHRQTVGETSGTASEQRRTHAEHRRTASEHRQDLGEIGVTASEHRRGDVKVGPVEISKAPEIRRRRSSNVVRHVRHELLNGPETLKRALVLKEILDKPIGIRPG